MTRTITVTLTIKEAKALLTAAFCGLDGDDNDRIAVMENRADLRAADRGYDKVQQALFAVSAYTRERKDER